MYPSDSTSVVFFLSLVAVLIGMVLLPVEIVVQDNVAEEELVEE